MFETLQQASPDPILGLTIAFNSDPNPNKINLGVGVYKDANGFTPVFKAVKIAVSADVSGHVLVVKVVEHQEVRKGDMLFRIDTDPSILP